jgi:pre-mRNA-processing factor SLU7
MLYLDNNPSSSVFHSCFVWEAYEKGGDVHLQADPTKLEVLANEFSRRKESMKSQVKDSILDKYGGQEHLEAPPKQLLMAQTVSGKI